MVLSAITIEQLEQRFGQPLRYSSDYESLASDIQTKTNRPISTNTIKRLTGTIESVREPRIFTLDTIAEYLGYKDWDTYFASISEQGNSVFGDKSLSIDATTLPIGSKVEFHYQPSRRVVVQKEEDGYFKVTESEGGKLQVGDIIEIEAFHLGFPLIVKNVFRNGIDMGQFTAGRIRGIDFLKILE